MGVFMDSFRKEMNRREAERVRARLHQFAQEKSDSMRSEGASASDIAGYLSPILGCPCCGPEWYRALMIEAYKEEGISLPPELTGVSS